MRDLSTMHMPVEVRSMSRVRPKAFGRRFKPNKGVELLAGVCIAVLFTVCGAVFVCSGLLDSNKIYDNITISGVAVGGLTADEAMNRFAALQSSVPSPLQVTIDGRAWTIVAADIDAKYNVSDTVKAAHDVGRGGSTFANLNTILSLRAKPKQLTLSIKYDNVKLKAAVDKITGEASSPARIATMQFRSDSAADPDLFTITPEVNGKTVDADTLLSTLQRQLDTDTPSALYLQSKPALPQTTAAQLKAQTQLLASFTTALTQDPVRNNNIKLAGDAVNGAVIFPGSEFSFNTLTGERTKSNGYVDAPAISNGQLVDAPGGGVCQVASTIYNAALLSGLDVVERHHHTWPMSYVTAGLDATVDYASGKDLKLKNNSNVAIYLILRVDEAKHMVTAEFFGMPTLETISVTSEDLQPVMPDKPLEYGNPNQPIGWSKTIVQAKTGYKVNIYRVFTSGTDTRKELISNDFYPPIQGKTEIGTKAPPAGTK